MSKISFRLKNATDLQHVYAALSQVDYTKNMVVDLYEDKETRSSKQNSLLHIWYEALGGYAGNGKEHETRHCKLHYGVPIVRRDNRDYRATYNQCILGLQYEDKLIAMDLWPVTRSPFMNVAMMTEYLNAIEEYAAGTLEFQLPHPDDLYLSALGRE